MFDQSNNVAYIDGANLYRGIREVGWELDYGRFRVWLRERYAVKHAYLFIGLVPKYKDLYTMLQEAGYTLVFKETVPDGDGQVKGNCDADLVLWVMRGVYEEQFDRAVIVSGDGDYAGLVKFLMERQKIRAVLSPNRKCSILLKRTGAPIVYIGDQKRRLRHGQK